MSGHSGRRSRIVQPQRAVIAIVALALLLPVAAVASTRGSGSQLVSANYTVDRNPPQFTISSRQIELSPTRGGTAAATLFSDYPTIPSDMTFTFNTNSSPTFGVQDGYALARVRGNSSYAVRLRYRADGSLSLRVLRTVNGATRAISTEKQARGVTWSRNANVQVRVVVTGRWPTTIKAKAWLAGTSQPAHWLLAVRDHAGALQHRGAIGVAAQAATSNVQATGAGSATTFAYSSVKAQGRNKHAAASTPDPTTGSTPTPTPPAGSNPTPTPRATPTPSPRATPTPTAPPVAPSGNCPNSLATAISSTPAGGTLDIRGCRYAGEFTISRSMTLSGGAIVGRLFIKGNDVTIDGLDISGSTAGAQQGMIDVPKNTADRLTLRNVHAHDGDGTGIRIRGGSGQLLDNVEIDHMLQLGYAFVSTTGLVMRNSRIHDNNYTDKYTSAWEAGGGKMTGSTNALIANNESWGNHGPGFWEDIYNHGSVYRGNRAWQNTGPGIMIEVSFDAKVVGNVLWQNYYGRSRTWVQSASIVSHSSTGTQITGNVVANTDIGIGIDVQKRSDWPNIHPVKNVRVEGNYVINCNALIAWGDDYQKELFDPSSGNGSAGNFFWTSQAEPAQRFAWNSQWLSTLAAYQNAGADTGSRYMTTAEKNAVLASVGL